MIDKIVDFFTTKIPIAEGTKWFTDQVTDKFSFLFEPIKKYFGSFMDFTSDTLIGIPPFIIIIIVALIAFFLSGKRFGLATFSVIGLWLINNQGYWVQDRKSTRLNSSHVAISYAVFCLKKKKKSKE